MNAIPPAAWKWFTSASPLGYIRLSSGTTADRSDRSSQVSVMPAARAIATRCIVWLVEPPLASSATQALTIAFSSTIVADRRAAVGAPCGVISVTRRPAARVSASRSGVPGLTKDEPGRCRPSTSISSWLEFAVP